MNKRQFMEFAKQRGAIMAMISELPREDVKQIYLYCEFKLKALEEALSSHSKPDAGVKGEII